jgi:aspartate-semialdehyde dehydrogenase
MAEAGHRIAVFGATGAIGVELIETLSASSLRVSQILPIATGNSEGADVEFQDVVYPVETELPSLRGLDLVFLCAPPAASTCRARSRRRPKCRFELRIPATGMRAAARR